MEVPLIWSSWQSIWTNVVFPRPPGAVNRSSCTSSFNSNVFNFFIGISNPTVKSGGSRTAHDTLGVSMDLVESILSRIPLTISLVSNTVLAPCNCKSTWQNLKMSSSNLKSLLEYLTIRTKFHHGICKLLRTSSILFDISSIKLCVFSTARPRCWFDRSISSTACAKRSNVESRRLRMRLN